MRSGLFDLGGAVLEVGVLNTKHFKTGNLVLKHIH